MAEMTLIKDFRFENHGSIVLMYPLSDAAKAWTEENVGNDETMHWGDAVVIEPRYVPPIVDGIIAEGMTF